MRLPDRETSRAVLMGVGSYQKLPDLPGVHDGAAELKTVLTDPRHGSMLPEHCVLLPENASTSDVRDAIERAAEQAKDLLLIYFAGHGLIGPRRGELYLAVPDTRPDRPGGSGILFEDVRDMYLDSVALAKVVILDCCFSGRALGRNLSGTNSSILDEMSIAGTAVLTSAPPHSVAKILDGEPYPAYSGRLLRLLREGLPGGLELLTMPALYKQLYRELKAVGLREPQAVFEDLIDQLGLVRNRAWQGIPLASVDLPSSQAADDNHARPDLLSPHRPVNPHAAHTQEQPYRNVVDNLIRPAKATAVEPVRTTQEVTDPTQRTPHDALHRSREGPREWVTNMQDTTAQPTENPVEKMTKVGRRDVESAGVNCRGAHATGLPTALAAQIARRGTTAAAAVSTRQTVLKVGAAALIIALVVAAAAGLAHRGTASSAPTTPVRHQPVTANPRPAAAVQLQSPDFTGYCTALAQGSATLVGGNASGWKCTGAAGSTIDLDAACRWTNNDTQAHASIADYYRGTVVCWNVTHDFGAPDFAAYCRYLHYPGATYTNGEGVYGWTCTNDPAPFRVDVLCQWQYGSPNITAIFNNFVDPNSWRCWG